MADIIKTEYMGKANIGFSEYIVKKVANLNSIPAKPGDRAIIQEEGSIYICIEGGQWEKLNLPTGGGGGSITIDDEMSDSSTNAVQNKVIKGYVDTEIANIPVDSALSDVSENPVQNKVVKNALDGKLDLAGGTMVGSLNMGGNNFTSVGMMAFAANKNLNMNSGRIINLATPTSPLGAANKKYVDDTIAAALIVDTEEVIS